MKTILVIGKGGREHAIAWRLAHEGMDVLLAPGNWGTAQDTLFETLSSQPMDHASLRALVKRRGVTDIIVGPEVPLCEGLADALQDCVRVFGPVSVCAELEQSKAFAKSAMNKFGIPTADYETFKSVEDAQKFVQRTPWPMVIKADGLAGGKGVILPETVEEAHFVLERMMVDGQFGASGAQVVIEERLVGPEVSLMVMTNGLGIYVLPTSQDHKRQLDGDRGPNTGGMGAVSPSPDIDSVDDVRSLVAQFISPILNGFRTTTPYQGFLYAGLMLTSDGPRALEYNVRLGDPETQALLFGLDDRFSDAIISLNDGFDGLDVLVSTPSCCITLACEGYPRNPQVGHEITDSGCNGAHQYVFSAGVNDGFRTGGGRVLTVVGKGESPAFAREAAYERAAQIRWKGMQYRADIGLR